MEYIVNYLNVFENIDINDALELLSDYYRMAKDIGRDVKKYPKYLRSMHDIISANYDAYKREYDEELFQKTINKELEFEGKDFCVMVPVNPKQIISEGTDLNHCVGSYVDKVIKRETYIMFLRNTKTKDKSLVTLEYQDQKITQAKGSYNRRIDEDETKFLNKYCEKKKIELCL